MKSLINPKIDIHPILGCVRRFENNLWSTFALERNLNWILREISKVKLAHDLKHDLRGRSECENNQNQVLSCKNFIHLGRRALYAMPHNKVPTRKGISGRIKTGERWGPWQERQDHVHGSITSTNLRWSWGTRKRPIIQS